MSKILAQHVSAGCVIPNFKESRRDGGDESSERMVHHESLCANRRKTSFNPPANPSAPRINVKINFVCSQ
jgi:hypothetical protein